MNAIAGPSLGFSRSATLRSLGTALAKASRTIRRCTPSFFPTPLIVPTPCSYSLRISSNSSTFLLLSNRTSFPASIWRNEGTRFLVIQGGANSDDRKGPIQSIEIRRKNVLFWRHGNRPHRMEACSWSRRYAPPYRKNWVGLWRHPLCIVCLSGTGGARSRRIRDILKAMPLCKKNGKKTARNTGSHRPAGSCQRTTVAPDVSG